METKRALSPFGGEDIPTQPIGPKSQCGYQGSGLADAAARFFINFVVWVIHLKASLLSHSVLNE